MARNHFLATLKSSLSLGNLKTGCIHCMNSKSPICSERCTPFSHLDQFDLRSLEIAFEDHFVHNKELCGLSEQEVFDLLADTFKAINKAPSVPNVADKHRKGPTIPESIIPNLQCYKEYNHKRKECMGDKEYKKYIDDLIKRPKLHKTLCVPLPHEVSIHERLMPYRFNLGR